MTLIISPAAPEDAEAIANLAARTFPLACPPGCDPDDVQSFVDTNLDVTRFAAYLDDPDRVVLVAADPQPVGYAMMVTTAPTDAAVIAALGGASAVEVNKFYVDTRAHGLGVAGALMDAAAGAVDRSALWLGVNKRNVRAQKFYAAQGFAVVGERRFTLGRTIEHDFVMLRH